MSDRITIEARGIEEFAYELGADISRAEPAMRTAVIKTTRWAGNEARRKVAKVTKVSGRVLKGRMVVDASGDFGRVWVGLKPINLKRLNPRQTGSGVTAGPAKRPGAFISSAIGGHVFERVGASRLPIRKSAPHDIEDAGSAAVVEVSRLIEDRLMKEFERAWNWQQRKK